MSTITLPNVRACSDITLNVQLTDSGVAIDWSGLSNIRALIYSQEQSAIAGRCTVSVDPEDSTVLVCEYAGTKPQYLGINSIIIRATYQGRMKTYDKPAMNIVATTAEVEDDVVTVEDPELDVTIEVTDVSSSILDNAIAAAIDAADRAEEAAEAAEEMVDLHTGPEGKSAYEVAVDNGYQGTETEWLASLKGDTGETPDITIGTVTTAEPGTPAAATMTGTPEDPVLNLTIPQGAVGATPNFTVGTVTTGAPGTSVVVTITGTAEAPVLNITIPQGMQGNTGSSVDYAYELVNNLTTDDATKGLSAAQGVVLEGEISQLSQKVGKIETPALSIEQGNISTTTGEDSSSSSILRTVGFISADKIIVNAGTGKVYAHGYADDGTYLGGKGWLFDTNDVVQITGAKKYRLVFSNGSDTTITPADFSGFGFLITAIYVGEDVAVNREQGLNSTEKAQARENIDAAPIDEVTYYRIDDVNVAVGYADWHIGYIQPSGVPKLSAGSYRFSDKIPIIPDSKIVIKQLWCNASAILALGAYDATDNLISDCSYSGPSVTTSNTPVEIDTTGKNVSYIRITIGGGLSNYIVNIKRKVVDETVKEKITNSFGESKIVAPEVENGYINISNGNDLPSNKRVRSIGYFYAERVVVNTGLWEVQMFGYAKDGTYKGCTNILYDTNDVVEISGAAKYRFFAQMTNTPDVTPEDFEDSGVVIRADIIGNFVSVDDSQGLSETQKARARGNIDSAKEEDVTLYELVEVNATDGYSDWLYGYTNTSGIPKKATSGAYHFSDKIPIIPDSKIVIKSLTCNASAFLALAAYDANNALVSDCSYSGPSVTTSNTPVEIDTTGKNVSYIRITILAGYASYYVGIKRMVASGKVKEKVVEIEGALQNIQVGTQWNGKSWVALGTSITDTNNNLDPNGDPTGKFVPYLVTLSGLSVTNKGVAGAVIGGHILYYAGHTAETANADIITIEGGVNDWAGSKPLGQVGDTVPYLVEWSSPVWNNGGSADGTFAGACYQAIKTAMDNSPKAVVVVITDNTGQHLAGTGANCAREQTNSLGLRQKDYTDMLIAVANYMGVPVINAGQKSMINQDNPDYLIDQIHQTELGGKQFANVIWSELKNFPCRITE